MRVSKNVDPLIAESQSDPVGSQSPGALVRVYPSALLAQRDRMVLEHLALVKIIALKVRCRLPEFVDLDDLVHSGMLGLLDAASKFDPKKNVNFSAYAKHRIRGAILDSLRQLDCASRDMRRHQRKVEEATRDLTSRLQRVPTEAEMAEKFGMSLDRWHKVSLQNQVTVLISASTRANEDNETPIQEFLGKAEMQPESICAQGERSRFLSAAVKVLSERSQTLLLLYYTDELTMKEIGIRLGINESRVSQLHNAALAKMAVALEAGGISSSHAF
jgi:RNA polymerase sigma factor for flagellar operon FliA